MKLIFSEQAWEDYLYWQNRDRRRLRRIHQLITETCRNPYEGMGKPEPLRHVLQGYWSRRIDGEHRFVYKPTEQGLLIAQLRYHYKP